MSKNTPIRLIAIFLLMAIAIAVAGYYYAMAAETRRELIMVGFLTTIFLIALAAMTALLLNRRLIQFYRQRYAEEMQRKSMEERLRLLNEEWNKTFNAITDLIFIQDKDNTILKANKAFADSIGTTVEDVIGKKCYTVVHKMAAPWPTCPLEKTKLDEKPHTEEVNDPNIGGTLLITTSPIFNDKGGIMGAVHIARDISGLKKTENELKRKIKDLERFQKITIDRELKMKELKTRIAELEANIKPTNER